MSYHNEYYDPISTVQLSPFVEEQWHRIDTYSATSVDWADMSANGAQRTFRPTSGKLNTIDQVDLNTLKLDDEILLNELHDIRRGSALLAKAKQAARGVKDSQSEKLPDDRQNTPSLLNPPEIRLKQTQTEPSFVRQQQQNTSASRPLSSSKTFSFSSHPIQRFPSMNFGLKSQPSLAAQLRQSAITRQNVLLATNDLRPSTPASSPTPKRHNTSAHSGRHCHQQQYQELPMKYEVNSICSNDELSNDELPLSLRRPRAKSAYSSRSTVHLLKAKNDRIRQQHHIELKSLLIKPWKTASWNDVALETSIPNSLDMMHRMCGPATPFERILRQDFRKRLNLYRHNSVK
ncbi:unnamed protein product [Adineta ricciae]|uniref:Uncharacterized protein n=1 Tax=Adineta ricciae TaxID=249248 RepID=A0A815YYR4_ADIRI|nr:unnamed protein product [Adineta ricciae]CAF1575949.1 unnamed protein product [Adineta ricciae]